MLATVFAQAQFIDVSNEMNIVTNHVGGYHGTGLSMADFNGDGLDDLSFAQFDGFLEFYEGNGTGFSPVTLVLPYYPHEAKAILWADIDNDGDQDLFVTYRLAPNKLYRNHGDMTFTDVSVYSGLDQFDRRSYGACFGDYDADGLLDLFVANYVIEGVDEPHNELYHNLGGGSFENVTNLWDIGEENIENSFQGHWVDFDEDELLDLHVIRDRIFYENKYYRQQPPGSEQLFINQAHDMGLDYSINCMSTSIADYDRDNDLDLYLTGGFFEGNMLLDNTDGLFALHDYEDGDSLEVHETSWAGQWMDLDNDGWEDLHVAAGFSQYTDYPTILSLYPNVPDQFYWNNEGTFMKDTSGFFDNNVLSFSTAMGDFNLDGFPDLVSNSVGYEARVFQAVPNANKWLKIGLKGTVSNRDGIGAKIRVYSNGTISYRMTFCGENFMGQNSRWEIFGLGNQQMADSVTVHWPSGLVDHYESVFSGQSIVLVEGETLSPCELLGTGCNGCTYFDACNFNPMALLDDGSCDFSCWLSPTNCGPGTLWDADSGQCAAIVPAVCPTDLNNDGATGIQDLLLFLAQFAVPCLEE